MDLKIKITAALIAVFFSGLSYANTSVNIPEVVVGPCSGQPDGTVKNIGGVMRKCGGGKLLPPEGGSAINNSSDFGGGNGANLGDGRGSGGTGTGSGSGSSNSGSGSGGTSSGSGQGFGGSGSGSTSSGGGSGGSGSGSGSVSGGGSSGGSVGSATGSGSGNSGGSGSGGSSSAGKTTVKSVYSIYYALHSKHSDDPSKICTGTIAHIQLTGSSQGYCKGRDSSGAAYAMAINKSTSSVTDNRDDPNCSDTSFVKSDTGSGSFSVICTKKSA